MAPAQRHDPAHHLAPPPVVGGLARDPKETGGRKHVRQSWIGQSRSRPFGVNGALRCSTSLLDLPVCSPLHTAFGARFICGFFASTRSVGRRPEICQSGRVHLELGPGQYVLFPDGRPDTGGLATVACSVSGPDTPILRVILSANPRNWCAGQSTAGFWRNKGSGSWARRTHWWAGRCP